MSPHVATHCVSMRSVLYVSKYFPGKINKGKKKKVIFFFELEGPIVQAYRECYGEQKIQCNHTLKINSFFF